MAEEVIVTNMERLDPSSLAREVFTFRKSLIDKRLGSIDNIQEGKPCYAPVSDVIFAWSIKEKLR
jgi:hypothetical protein